MAKLKKLVDVFTSTTKGFSLDLLPPGYGYGQKYKYRINLKQYGVGFNIMTWCYENCKSKWGWYFIPAKDSTEWSGFENQEAILTFKSRQDAVYYRLTHA